MQRRETGIRGEELVATYLERQGFEVVARNARVGRLELDVIARRGSLLVFCEVRSRTSSAFIDPILTIDRTKVRNLRKAAVLWLRANGVYAEELRFDAASVVMGA